MAKKPIFNNLLVTKLFKEYIHHKKDLKLRDKILKLTLPLIEASLSRQGMFRSKDDIRQECILKVLQAIPKFNPKRGHAFGFMWATICNQSKTINKRLHRPTSSLSTDESAQKEAEANGKDVFQTPENQHVLNLISEAVIEAFDTNGFVAPKRGLHRKACRQIQKAMASGEFFFDKQKDHHSWLAGVGLGEERYPALLSVFTSRSPYETVGSTRKRDHDQPSQNR